MKNSYLKIACLAVAAAFWSACADTAALEEQLTGLEDRVTAMEDKVTAINSNATAVYKLHTDGLIVMDVHTYGDKDNTVYRLDMSDGTSVDIYVAEDGKGITPTLGVDQAGNWTLKIFPDDEPVIVPEMGNAGGGIPQLGVSKEGFWQISFDNGVSWETITGEDGEPVEAVGTSFTDSFFTEVEYDKEKNVIDITMENGEKLSLTVYSAMITMEVENFEDGMDIGLSEPLIFYATFSDDVVNAYIEFPGGDAGWSGEIEPVEGGRHSFTITAPSSGTGEQTVCVYLESAEHYLRLYEFRLNLTDNVDYANSCEAWKDFKGNYPDKMSEAILLDYSYAGYKHGEEAPAEITVSRNGETYTASNGYKVYNIEDFGADGTDDASDRDAFIAMLTEAFGEPQMTDSGDQMIFPSPSSPANAVLYFPEGNFILHTSADDNKEQNKSVSIVIRGSNIIMKGAGRDKTTITMKDRNLPSSAAKYSSPDMIQFKHNTGIGSESDESSRKEIATVTADAPKGAFSVQVSGGASSQLKSGNWVCLYLKTTSQDAIAEELAPYTVEDASGWAIAGTDGVMVRDYHQIKGVSGNTVEFYEPVMHEVKAAYGWKIIEFGHYENVGIEDLTFAGNAKEDFFHHQHWEDDGAFKPVSMNRLVNSWMRRVDFRSVSEACSVIGSANVSVYDIVIEGNRGHSSIRSQGSSRVFIGAVRDRSEGKRMNVQGSGMSGSTIEVTGQYHATGVSKQSLGAVLWRNTWGVDGCFEAHATQPRATLIDCCKGGWMRYREGGAENQLPNHLNDLTVWNFNATDISNLSQDGNMASSFIWWSSDKWWKNLPAIIVGFHGQSVTFDKSADQTKYVESEGSPVVPESLYEAQLRNRLGAVPGWLTALKTLN